MRSFFFFLIILLSTSCQREESSWDVDIVAPIAKVEIKITDLLPDSILGTDNNGGLFLSISTELINLNPDSIITLKDTTISNGYTLPPPLVALNIDPGFPFPILPSNLNLETGNNIEVKEAIVFSGIITAIMINPLETPLDVTYIIPKLTLANESFTITETLPPAENSNTPSVTERSFNLSNYHLDLTGDLGIASNILNQSLSVINSPSAESVLITNTDTVKFNLGFEDLSFQYARGYFGNTMISESSGLKLHDFNSIHSSSIELEEASLTLNISNGVGADFRLSDASYSAVNSLDNLALTFDNDDINGVINITRAINLGTEASPTEREIVLNESNSNIVELLSLAPDSLNMAFNLEINPLGNTSSSNDFIYRQNGISILGDLLVPLRMTVNDLSISDSLQFNFSSSDKVKWSDGEIILLIENSFPLDIELDIQLIESDLNNSTVLINNALISSCELNGLDCATAESEIRIPVSSTDIENLQNGGLLLINGTFSSEGEIILKPEYFIKIQAIIDANIIVGI